MRKPWELILIKNSTNTLWSYSDRTTQKKLVEILYNGHEVEMEHTLCTD